MHIKLKKEKPLLKVYYWNICPHCTETMEFLRENSVPFEPLDIERQTQDVVDKVVEVNGGEDWVVPTLEYCGNWRAGERFDAESLRELLRKWGLLPSDGQ